MPDHDKEHDKYFSPKQDTYLDQTTGILKNIPALQTKDELESFEEIIFQAHFGEATTFIAAQKFIGLGEWREVHKICFEDVYGWAGELRTIRIAKGSTIFAYPEGIEPEAAQLFTDINTELEAKILSFKKTAEYFAEVNVLHPFREGNGRTQRILFSEIFKRIGFVIDYNLTNQDEMTKAMISGYKGNTKPVIELFREISTAI